MVSRRYLLAPVVALLALITVLAARNKPDSSDAVDQQKRALHAFNRLTFGPRPGDVQAVMSMGVDKWIETQLHPDKISDSALQARLAPLHTINMSSRELALAFPSNQVLKAVQDGKLPMPSEPYRRAIYSANLVRLEHAQEKKQNAANQPGPLNAQNPAPAMRNANVDLAAPPARDETGWAPAQHNRLIDDLSALPADSRMNRILLLPPDQQSQLMQGVPLPKRTAVLAGLSAEQRETVLALNAPQTVVNYEIQSAKLLRAVYGERQLEEVLTDFWFNHFNVYIGKGADRYLITEYERDVIRPHVLGKFKDLLLATARSPAMLFYLDNWQSEGPHSDAALGIPEHPRQQPHPIPHRNRGPFGTRPVYYPVPRSPRPQQAPKPNPQPNQQKRRSGLNENYARELMELHTLGVNGGYTQQDVTEVARVFTGWTINEPREGGDFIFKPRLHEPGVKTVLGHKIKENGEKEGLEVLTLLSRQPATARFVSAKLAERFVSDTPPQSLVDAMAKTFLKTDGDLREVLRTMFRSREFWAPEAYNAKVKTPLEYVVSSLRATQADITEPQPLLNTLNQMGMSLYGMQPPTGYSTKADVWVNSAALLDRMNFGLQLVNNRLPGTQFDLARLTGNPTQSATDIDPYQVQLKLEQVLLSGQVSAQTHRTIEQQIMVPQPATAQSRDSQQQPNPNIIAALLLGSPEFQRH